jgi:hypothetical protein
MQFKYVNGIKIPKRTTAEFVFIDRNILNIFQIEKRFFVNFDSFLLFFFVLNHKCLIY